MKRSRPQNHQPSHKTLNRAAIPREDSPRIGKPGADPDTKNFSFHEKGIPDEDKSSLLLTDNGPQHFPGERSVRSNAATAVANKDRLRNDIRPGSAQYRLGGDERAGGGGRLGGGRTAPHRLHRICKRGSMEVGERRLDVQARF